MLSGVVVRGDGRGKDLGFPTANLDCPVGDIPPDGIYAAWVRIDGAVHRRQASVSVGTNPTFAGRRRRRVEVHLHDVDVDLYGCRLDVELVAFLRETLRFDDVDGLIAQSRRDVALSRSALAESRSRVTPRSSADASVPR